MQPRTIYIEEPGSLHEAWAALVRLIECLDGLFFLIAATTDPETNIDNEEATRAINNCALLGQELAEEAKERAETVHDFAMPQRKDTPATTAQQAPVAEGEAAVATEQE
jgi:hypothetical protein